MAGTLVKERPLEGRGAAQGGAWEPPDGGDVLQASAGQAPASHPPGAAYQRESPGSAPGSACWGCVCPRASRRVSGSLREGALESERLGPAQAPPFLQPPLLQLVHVFGCVKYF